MVENRKKSLKDFEIIKKIGEGSFGSVYLAKEKATGVQIALKSIDKTHIIRFNKSENVYRERDILRIMADHPNIINLVCTFQDEERLYFGFDYCPNGTLSTLISLNIRLEQNIVKLLAAELINGLEAIHNSKVIHRDLKPENILLTKDNHIKIIDFGDANYFKLENDDEDEHEEGNIQDEDIRERRSSDDSNEFNSSKQREFSGTFVGTAYYVSPEMLNQNYSCPASDLWALGCIIYRMLIGEYPFYGDTDYQIFQRILSGNIQFPSSIEISDEAKDLIERLLQIDPLQRLGAGVKDSKNGYHSLKSHPFFEGIDFDLINKQLTPINISPPCLGEGPFDCKSWVDLGGIDYESSIVHKGDLYMKRGKIPWSDIRSFTMTNDGFINYYKDKTEYRGQIQLSEYCCAEKTSHDRFELFTPTRRFFFQAIDSDSNDVDKWVQKLTEVISQLNEDE